MHENAALGQRFIAPIDFASAALSGESDAFWLLPLI